jgi:hypothetical protein
MNRPRNNRGAGVQDKMTEFIRLKPPTFAGSDNPMEADGWLKVIERKLDTIQCNGRNRCYPWNGLVNTTQWSY